MSGIFDILNYGSIVLDMPYCISLNGSLLEEEDELKRLGKTLMMSIEGSWLLPDENGIMKLSVPEQSMAPLMEDVRRATISVFDSWPPVMIDVWHDAPHETIGGFVWEDIAHLARNESYNVEIDGTLCFVSISLREADDDARSTVTFCVHPEYERLAAKFILLERSGRIGESLLEEDPHPLAVRMEFTSSNEQIIEQVLAVAMKGAMN